MLSEKEVAEHASRKSCWVIIEGQAYDLTDFLDEHPGGSDVILRYAGRDATMSYVPIHPPGTLEKNLSPEYHLGPVDQPQRQQAPFLGPSSVTFNGDAKDLIPLRLCQNVLDFEIQAAKVLSNRSYTYFHSAADSLQSFKANLQDWNKIRFRPRVLRNVAKVDMNARIMGQHCRLPFFISPMAMIKLADDEGELAFARAATAKQIPYAVSTYASCTLDDIAGCVRNEKLNMPMFQLYVPKDRNSCIRLLRTCRKLGFKALLVTVDTPVVGKREEDDRYKAQIDLEAGIPTPPTAVADVTEDSEEPPILRSFHSSTLSWDDLTWIREAWQNAGPIYLKGIQCAEDAVLAAQAGVDGIYLSNHGGRQLDHAPSALQTLLEIHRFCPQILDKLEIYLDGGVRRGSDIIKAICLGARGVGLGRPFVYALGAYKREGVLRAIELLSDELETAMRLLGVNRLSELNVHYVNTKELERDIVGSIRTDQSPRARL